MTKRVNSYISLFEDDAKIPRNHKECEELQNDINMIVSEWSKTWKMEFIAKKKNHIMEIGKSGMRPSWTYKLGQNIISIAKEDKNLRVVM